MGTSGGVTYTNFCTRTISVTVYSVLYGPRVMTAVFMVRAVSMYNVVGGIFTDLKRWGRDWPIHPAWLGLKQHLLTIKNISITWHGKLSHAGSEGNHAMEEFNELWIFGLGNAWYWVTYFHLAQWRWWSWQWPPAWDLKPCYNCWLHSNPLQNHRIFQKGYQWHW